METKDWLYAIGIISTLAVSLIALVINIRNRRNAIREHLYKEQMKYFHDLFRNLNEINNTFYEVVRLGLNEEIYQGLDALMEKTYDHIEANDFITPDPLFKPINTALKSADDLFSETIKAKGKLTKEEIKPSQSHYFELVEEVREFLGIDKLSEENLKLLNGRMEKRSR